MRFLEVLVGEAKNIFTDLAIVLTVVGGVVLYSFLYPQPYMKMAVSELKVVVIDHDKSDTTRQLKFMLEATPQIDIIAEVPSLLEAKKLFVSGGVKGIIIFDENFKRDLYLGKQPSVAVAADASYFLILGSILTGASKAILTESATLKIGKIMSGATPLVRAKKEYTPYTLNVHALFNPQNSYVQYVIPAVFIIILQQTLLIGLGILGGRDNENLNFRTSCAPVWMVMTSRIVIFMSLFMVHFLFYFGFSFEFYNIVHLGAIGDILTFGFAFLLSATLLGLTLGALFPNREMVTPIIVFSSLPLVFSAGFVWPIEALPSWIVTLSLFSPTTPAIQGFLQLNQMGASFSEIMVPYATLWLQILFYGLLAYALLSHKREIKAK